MFDSAQSFVIKIWLEPGGSPVGRLPWRGQITHLPSRESRAVRRLDDITVVIAGALERSGADPGWHWRWGRHWRTWTGRPLP
ncbi:hypothetical protein GCM10008949_25500 [Deinococcus humi]|nr:hypothetical protein GCM10008949_25500 [Deinococcus humi]